MKIELKKRNKDSHKGDSGHVIVIGGCEDYSGAVALSAMAALRSGCDLVSVIAPEKVSFAINCLYPDIIAIKVQTGHFTDKHVKFTLNAAKKADCLLIGPGIGAKSDPFIRKIVERVDCAKVIDAQAIAVIDLKKERNSVMTPHASEYKKLVHNLGFSSLEPEKLQPYLNDNIVLLKGMTDKIISKNAVFENQTGNSGMTVGGTGDVLAGIVAGLIAQGNDKFTAAYAAARINGLIGDQLFRIFGFGFIASDFLNIIPKMLMKEAQWKYTN